MRYEGGVLEGVRPSGSLSAARQGSQGAKPPVPKGRAGGDQRQLRPSLDLQRTPVLLYVRDRKSKYTAAPPPTPSKSPFHFVPKASIWRPFVRQKRPELFLGVPPATYETAQNGTECNTFSGAGPQVPPSESTVPGSCKGAHAIAPRLRTPISGPAERTRPSHRRALRRHLPPLLSGIRPFRYHCAILERSGGVR